MAFGVKLRCMRVVHISRFGPTSFAAEMERVDEGGRPVETMMDYKIRFWSTVEGRWEEGREYWLELKPVEEDSTVELGKG